MKQTKRSKKRIAAARLYAVWLLLYPRAHRQVYGPLMLQAFIDSYRDALATQGRTGMRFWLGVVGDEAKSLVREHGTALREEADRVKQWRFAIASGALLLGSVLLYLAKCPI